MSTVSRIIYGSTATVPFDDAALMALLAQSRKNNLRCGICGALLYHDGSFLQVLEGPDDALQTVLARIIQDSRHHDLFVLTRQTGVLPAFSEWTMGWVNAQAVSEAGFNPALFREQLYDDHRVETLVQAWRACVQC